MFTEVHVARRHARRSRCRTLPWPAHTTPLPLCPLHCLRLRSGAASATRTRCARKEGMRARRRYTCVERAEGVQGSAVVSRLASESRRCRERYAPMNAARVMLRVRKSRQAVRARFTRHDAQRVFARRPRYEKRRELAPPFPSAKSAFVVAPGCPAFNASHYAFI